MYWNQLHMCLCEDARYLFVISRALGLLAIMKTLCESRLCTTETVLITLYFIV